MEDVRESRRILNLVYQHIDEAHKKQISHFKEFLEQNKELDKDLQQNLVQFGNALNNNKDAHKVKGLPCWSIVAIKMIFHLQSEELFQLITRLRLENGGGKKQEIEKLSEQLQELQNRLDTTTKNLPKLSIHEFRKRWAMQNEKLENATKDPLLVKEKWILFYQTSYVLAGACSLHERIRLAKWAPCHRGNQRTRIFPVICCRIHAIAGSAEALQIFYIIECRLEGDENWLMPCHATVEGTCG